MDAIDIIDTAFSLEGISTTNEVVKELGENTDTTTNIFVIIGILIFIGIIFLYSYFSNKMKKVTFQENNNEVFEYHKSV